MSHIHNDDNSTEIVICDGEEFYALHLQEYLDNHNQIPCPISIYTGAPYLLERQKPSRTRLLIIAESEYIPYRQEIEEAGYEKILILNETNRMLSAPWPDISKYQATDHILSAILEILGNTGQEDIQTIRHAGEMHLIGFYTPLTRCLQTSFALTMGTLLGEKHKVLYLNFENWPALLPKMTSQPSGGISQLVYFNDCAKEKVGSHLQRIACHEGGLDLVMPCGDFLQMQQITGEQWLSLLETIRQVSEYEYILLDLSETMQGLLDILGHCESIYTIERADDVGEARMESYRNFLRTWKVQELAARTTFLQLPLFDCLPVRIVDYGKGPLAEYVALQLQGPRRADTLD